MSSATIIKRVTGIATQDGAGVKLSRIIGQRDLPNLDPFLMLDEFGSNSAQDYLPGFPGMSETYRTNYGFCDFGDPVEICRKNTEDMRKTTELGEQAQNNYKSQKFPCISRNPRLSLECMCLKNLDSVNVW